MKITCLKSCCPSFIDLNLEETVLVVQNTLKNNVMLFGQYDECEKCNLQPVCIVQGNSSSCLILDTQFTLKLLASTLPPFKCSWNRSFMAHYQYYWNLGEGCNSIYKKKIAMHPYLPIIFLMLSILLLITIKTTVYCCRNKICRWCQPSNKKEDNVDGGDIDVVNPGSGRVGAVDVFRGICVVLMIFVNYGGGHYWFFRNSVWNGLTAADLIFPWFLWLCGFSMFTSFHSKLRRGLSRLDLLKHVFKRSIALFVIGFMINTHAHGGQSLSTLKILGTLQRIGMTYLVIGALEVALMKRAYQISNVCFSQEVCGAWPEWSIILLLAIGHAAVLLLVDVPGCGRGYLGPGGLHNGGDYTNCTAGLTGYIDRQILGDHIAEDGMRLYENRLKYERDGFLGILTSGVLIMLGVQAAKILQTNLGGYQRIARWITIGVAFSLVGAILCSFSKNNGFIPINRKMWSLSFVCVTGGLAFFVFAILFVAVDISKHWQGFPFHYLGMNPLLIYIFQEIFKESFPFKWGLVTNTHAEYFCMNLLGIAIWIAFSYYLFKKGIFVFV